MFSASILTVFLSISTAQTDRFVSVTWANNTGDVRQLQVSTPVGGREVIGSFTRGGQLSVSIPVGDTPVQVSWRAGDLSGSFVVGPRTASSLRIDLGQQGARGPYEAPLPVPR